MLYVLLIIEFNIVALFTDWSFNDPRNGPIAPPDVIILFVYIPELTDIKFANYGNTVYYNTYAMVKGTLDAASAPMFHTEAVPEKIPDEFYK